MNIFLITCIFMLTSISLMPKNGVQMHEHYKKIADGLIGIRKEYPVTQPKVYGMLDQLDKLLSRAKKTVVKKQQYRQKVQSLTVENTSLKQELSTVRGEVSTVRKSIESARSELALQFEQEKRRADQLTQERKDLLQKVALLEQRKDENFAKENLVTKVTKDLQKQDLDALSNEKVAARNQPSFRRISTSEPSSPR